MFVSRPSGSPKSFTKQTGAFYERNKVNDVNTQLKVSCGSHIMCSHVSKCKRYRSAEHLNETGNN